MAKINPEEADLCCDSCEVHENLVKIVNETMPDETELYDLAELFKVFGDSTRIQILFVLFEAEVCVCDLAEALHMTQSAISHQLRILKQNKLVKGALGSDAAIEAADIVLMDDDPLKISKAIHISRKCIHIVYENIYFAIGIKVLFLLLGAIGIANMWMAIFADVGVMILAVLNAIRALFVKNL